ncbi:MAG: class B sortase [Oscillospiraceae bacterium]
MALSKEAQRAYKKAEKTKQKKHKNKHWFFLRKGDNVKEICSKVFTQIAAVVLIVCVIILFDYFRAIFTNSHLNGSLQDLYGQVSGIFNSGELLPNAKQLLEINPDTVGWVKIDDTKVDLPVVLRQDEKEGNTYYLRKNFNGENAKAGTVFADYRTTITPKKHSDNIVLYGHNEKDNTMFGDLDQYKKSVDFYKSHPIVHFNTNYAQGDYKIFAYFVTTVLPKQDQNGTVFDYHNYIDMDKARYKQFMENIMSRSKITTDIDVKYGDEFLTLSTCSSEFEPSRFVVFARKVRKGEEPTINTDAVKINPNAKSPDLDFIYYGKKK